MLLNLEKTEKHKTNKERKLSGVHTSVISSTGEAVWQDGDSEVSLGYRAVKVKVRL